MTNASPQPLYASCSAEESTAVAEATHPSSPQSGPSPAEDHVDGAGSPCPTPLAWQEVVTTVREQSESWQTDGRIPLSGRTLGTGIPLYLLGGAMADSELTSLLAWLLQDEYRCVMVDYPNLTELSQSSRLNVVDLSHALLDVADRHDDERIHIYGSSLGAAIALQAAHDTPDRIGSMILHAASAHLKLSIGERLALAMGRWFTRPIGCWPGAAAVFRWNHARWFPPFDATRWGFLEMKLTATPTSLIARRVQTQASFDLRGKLSQVTPRTVLLTTEGDGVTLQRYQKELTKGLPHCDVHEMDATGHFPHLTHPHRLAKLVRQVIPQQSVEDASTAEQAVEKSYALENS